MPLQKAVQLVPRFNEAEPDQFLETFENEARALRWLEQHWASLVHSIVCPLTSPTSHKVPFNWTPECQNAFTKAKRLLCTAPILSSPDFSKPFSLHVDASESGVGAVLLQDGDEGLQPVAFYSSKFQPHQRAYSTIEKEALVLVLALEHFDIYVGQTSQVVTVYSDHNPLVYLEAMKNHNTRLMRWCLRLQHYSLRISHIAGKENKLADPLSRRTKAFRIHRRTWPSPLQGMCADATEGLLAKGIKAILPFLESDFIAHGSTWLLPKGRGHVLPCASCGADFWRRSSVNIHWTLWTLWVLGTAKRYITDGMSHNPNIIVTTADIRGGVVMLNTSDYNTKMIDLCMTSLLTNPSAHNTKPIQNRQILKRISEGKELLYLIPSNPKPAQMYGLPKTHKHNISLRPNTSGIGSEPYKLAGVLVKHLSCLLGTISPSHLKHSDDLNRIRDLSIRNKKLSSLGTTSLFTKRGMGVCGKQSGCSIRVKNSSYYRDTSGICLKDNIQNKVASNGKSIDQQTKRDSRGQRVTSSLKVYYTNSRSLRNKIDELRLLASVGNIDIIGITESWFNLKDREIPSECNIQGYKLSHTDRINRKGGGVVMYVRENLNCLRHDIRLATSNTESVWLQFLEGRDKLILGVIYRPPNLDREMQ
ncbi:uncharacterized protein [Cherax quadricarinatus]|uniref:uncharacterized protein n=1 Tax=Cherax quadricarinatus TaxID=27406 RepID=UPI00387E47C6